MPDERMIHIVHRYLLEQSSDDEVLELAKWVDEVANDDEFATVLNAAYARYTPDEKVIAQSAEALNRVEEKLRHHIQAPVHHISRARTRWMKYAAAIIIMVGLGTWFYLSNQNEKPSVATTNPNPVQNDVAPGGNRATLTLADGSKIVLDSAANGKIADEGTAIIEKKGAQVIYTSRLTPDASRAPLNTMATPRGGQYQLTLPDGTKVWLNAESSITYPTSFAERERRVSVTGEVYFEVTHDKTKPFRVVTHHASRLTPDDEMQIEVLGTKFNINAYNEEPTINTTLLEGSVRLTLHASRLTNKNAVHTSITLKPGQQGRLSASNLSLAANPDINQVMAWKNGVFNFEKIELAKALREIARWYDVEVIYPNGIPSVTLGGEMGRDLNLSEVLKVLQGLGVNVKLEQKKLYITQ